MSTQTRFSTLVSLLVVPLLISVTWVAAPPTDQDVTRGVNDALRHDPRVNGSRIEVSAEEGIVTLSGTVSTLASKKYADEEAKKINGVLGVVNEVVVVPESRPTLDIVMEVRRHILNNATIHTQGIHVACRNGIVTLSGKVDTYAEEEEAELLASEVRGVKEVHNNLLTAYESGRSDNEIKNDVTAALARDVYLSGLPITTVVKSGVVTLAGSVATTYEKDRAEDQVLRLTHVKTVENNLKVNAALNRDERKRMVWPSEEELQKGIHTELAEDSRIDATNVTVTVEYGHVTLNGSVKSYRESRLAAQDARDVVGVAWVTNNLYLRGDTRDDAAIRVDLDFELAADTIVQGLNIRPSVKNGVVTLEGKVHTLYEKAHAADVAARVRGVQNIVNHLAVDRASTHSDPAIANAIRARLLANVVTALPSTRLQVKVNNGVAVLTGDVDTWAQRTEAARVALTTEGVWRLDNRILVNGYDYPWDQWQYNGDYQFDPYYTPQHFFDYGL